MEVWKADDPLDRMIEEIAGELNAKGEAKKWIQTLNQNMFATNGSLDFVTSEDFQAMGIPLRVLAESRRKKAASSPSSASPSPSPSQSSNSSSPSTSTTSSPASSSSSVSAAGVGNLTKFQNLNLNPVTPLSIPSSSTPATPTSGASSGRNDRLSGEKERDDPRKKLSHSAKLPEELRRGSLPVSFATSPLTPTSTSSSSSVSSSSSSSSPSPLPSPSSSSSSSISRTSDEKKSSRRSTVSKKLSGKSKKDDPDQWMGVVNILSSSNDLIEKLLSYAGVDSSQKPDGLSFTRRYGIYDHSVSCQFYCNLLNASADYPIIWIFLFSFLDARTLSTLVDRFVTPRPKDELPAIIFAVLDKDKSVSGDRKTNVTEHVITESYLMTNSISLHNISSAKDCCFLFEDAARAVTREVVGSKSPDLVKKLQNAMQKQRSELMLPKKQISILPNQIYWLRLSLQRIRLDGNSFKFFPLELTDLPSLHEITLNNNQITEIPDCIQKLRSLQRLELENNRIEELPIAAIQSMVSLQDLKLKGNPLTKLPKIKGDYLQFVRDSPVPVSSIISSSSSASSNPFGQEIEYRSSESSAEKALFGMDLGERMKLERKTFPDLNLKVPKFVLECSRFILKYALSQEGVFRIGGTTNLITAIQESVDTGKFTEFKAGESPHNVTGLLKLYLRKLPECALLFSNFDKITALADLNWDKQQIEMKKILKSLPEDNYNLAKLIFRLMYLAGINNDLNRMDFGNVAKVVGPNLLFSLDLEKDPMAHLSSINSINDVLTMATQAYPEIFEDGSDPFEEEPFEKDTPVVLYRRLLGHTKSITSIVVSKDQKYLWTTDSNGYFRIWDTDTHKCIKQVNTEKKRINAMAIIGSDVWLGFMDGLQIRNCSDGTLIKELPGFPVFAMSVINDDIWIGDTGKFTVFTVDGIKETITFENGMTPVIFTQVAKDLLWVASTERKIGLFDLNSHIFYEEFDSQHTSRITSVVLVDESSVWTTADDGHIIVWDATTGELREKLPSKHNSKVFGASPFGDQVWSYSWNGEIHIWDRKTALYQGRVTDLNSDAVAAILPIWSPSLLCWKVYTAGWDRSVSVWLAKGEPQSPSRSSSSSPSSSADDVLPAAPEDPVPEEPSSPALSPEHSPDFDDLDEEAPQNLSSSGEVETDSSKPRRPAPSRSR